jgi:uncharacterized small protein (DUF1192 family)
MGKSFKLMLTPEQKEQIRKATGKDASTLELSVEELEERIAPTLSIGPRPK